MKAYLPIVPGSVARRTVKDMIADEIEGLIASGILRVGDKLPSERDLAGMFNVSRETIRGSLKLLETRGVLATSRGTRAMIAGEVRPKSPAVGITYASSISGYSVDDVFGARLWVERAIIAEAMRHATPAFIDKLALILESQERILKEPEKFFISDRSFHVTIYRQCTNRLMSDLAVDLYTYLLEQRQSIMDYPRARRGFEDHVAILDAMKAGDQDLAIERAGFHIDRQYRTSRMLVDQERSADIGKEPASHR